MASSFPAEPIAIIGSGCRFPGDVDSPSKLWELLREPYDVSSSIDRFNAPGFYNQDGHYHGASNVSNAYLLNEDPRAFDAQFFNIQAGEAESIDPQQRLLLETVYEALESAGLALENLRGSSTAVFVGVMCDDYAGIIYHDSESIPTYAATGISRAILSNRVSYVYDWRGPSMTIDTACSSSLVAIHQAVQILRDGAADLAVAAGVNLIFSPNMFIAESNLNMLSATGKSQMWDDDANGYARGEGIGAVVLKPLSAAIRDGDHIECIVRETGLNQDGHTPGITMPNADAQTQLIQKTYARAGLNLRNPADRCQYFEAHGTGTKAGDGVESRAIFNALFPTDVKVENVGSLYVGSIKTVIGHTEGTAGIAGVLRASLAMENKTIPPNMHFKTLNSEITPFYGPLKIATVPRAWPAVLKGGVRRASVNSFGFGGANAHVIIEAFDPSYHGYTPKEPTSAELNPLPLILSATSEKSLMNLVQKYLDFLTQNPKVDLYSLAWTLFHRRSTFSLRTTFSSQTTEALIPFLQATVEDKNSPLASPIIRPVSGERDLLGIFTGQGAQWATMGRDLIKSSKLVDACIDRLETALNELPPADRPSWSLKEQLLSDPESSRIAESEFSQPLCTAVQVALIDMLRASGVTFSRVVGHSSGEIGAAYAAGLINAVDAIKIAYYRGRFTYLARGPQGQQGAMIAAGTDMDDALELVSLPAFADRLGLAASNSSSSVTLSGDIDAVKRVELVLQDESRFNRMLKVDTAYHSHHMYPCSEPYRAALVACGIQLQKPDGAIRWYSSVHNGQLMDVTEDLKHDYWVQNMVQPVLFSAALRTALEDTSNKEKSPSMVVEVGPHPALQGPVSSTIEEVLGISLPYTGTLMRGKNDIDSIATALGNLCATFGRNAVDMHSYAKLFVDREPSLMRGLPAYPWNHGRTFWYESRESRLHRFRSQPAHSLLGTRVQTAGEREFRWRNYISPNEVNWLSGHKIQGQTLMPAAAFLTMAFEAGRIAVEELSEVFKDIRLIELSDSIIHRALGFLDDRSVETLFLLSDVIIGSKDSDESTLTASFQCNACPSRESASGKLTVKMGVVSPSLLLDNCEEDGDPFGHMREVDVDEFYGELDSLGYNYTELFKGVVSLKRSMNHASGEIHSTWTNPPKTIAPSPYYLHPSVLDVAFQTIFAALSHPGDGALWSLHIPTTIKRVVINPAACPSESSLNAPLSFTTHSYASDTGAISGDINLFSQTEEGSHALAQIESLAVTPIAPATEKNDRQMFADTLLCPMEPDLADKLATAPSTPNNDDKAGVTALERISLYYIRQLLTDDLGEDGVSSPLQSWAQNVVDLCAADLHPTAKREWLSDTFDNLEMLAEAISINSALHASYQRMVSLCDTVTARPEVGAAVHTHEQQQREKQRQLSDFYASSFGAAQCRQHLHTVCKQISMRFPQMRVLEIGRGDRDITASILAGLGEAFGTYTAVGVSAKHVEELLESHPSLESRLSSVNIALEQDIYEQNVPGGVYDLIIAPCGLPATKLALHNIRFLLKPGGYLVVLQATGVASLHSSFILGHLAVPAEKISNGNIVPDLEDWDSLYHTTGFSGLDTVTSDPTIPFNVFVTQAVDAEISAVRKPLASKTCIDHLLIIGGQRFPIARLIREVQGLLSPVCENIQVIRSLHQFETSMLASKPIVLFLSELDAPFFYNMTTLAFQNVQELFDLSKQVLWVVHGAEGSNPYGNMIKGMARTMISEFLNLFLQILNLESRIEDSGSVIAEVLIRMHITQKWKPGYQVTWSMERELTSQNGKLYVTRYIPNHTLDLGYNTIRRKVQTNVSPASRGVALEVTTENYGGEKKILSLRRHRLSPVNEYLVKSHQLATIDVTRSISHSIKISNLGYLYIVSGVNRGTDTPVLVLCAQHQSIVTVPSSRLVPVASNQENERNLLLATAGIFTASAILCDSATSGTVILHEPPSIVAHFVAILAAQKGMRSVFTTVQPEKDGHKSWIFLHKQSPLRMLQKAIPEDVVVFVDCSRNSPTAAKLRKQLPFGVRYQVLEDLLATSGAVYSGAADEDLQVALLNASSLAAQSIENLPVFEGAGELTIQNLARQDQEAYYDLDFRTIDWRDPSPVPAHVIPALEEVSFKADKTYFLIGMTGTLGLSTVMYMISRGARYFALASRRPQVDEKWLHNTQHTFGATIRIVALDVTSKEAVRDMCADLASTMPPIAGVANAALVIRDALFMEMNATKMNEALAPKVDGSLYLDEIFRDIELDFFILYSSLVYVTGNPGQTAYCAGNGFLVGLAHSRRLHGKTASVINLAGISGIGFISRTDHGILRRLDLMGYGVISEHDYLYLFAEAVLAGLPNSGRNPEVSGGLRFVDPSKDQGVPQWVEDPKFSHYLLDRSSSAGAVNVADAGDSVKAALLEARSDKDAITIVLDALLAMLHKRLRLPSDESVPADVAIVELGVDSLVAVEMRQWFSEEFDVNIPVMKMLGGATLAHLAEDVVNEMAADLIPLVKPSTFEEDRKDTKEDISSDGTPDLSDSVSESTISENASDESLSSSTTNSSFEDSSGMSKEGGKAVVSVRHPVFQRKVQMAIAATRFWFLHKYLSDDSCFNVVFRLRITGRIDESKVAETIQNLGNRHEVFRTCFYFDEKTNEPMQGVMAETRLRVEMKKITNEDAASAETDALIKHCFDIEGGEVIRIAWLSMSAQDHFMIIACHHMAFDGFSTNLLLSELDMLYRDQRMPIVQRQFTDFAVQQRREIEEGCMAKELAFWRGIYPNVPDPLPLFPLAGVQPRQALTAYTIDEASYTLENARVAKIRQVARQSRATVFHFMLAVFEVFLFRFLCVEDLVIGIADANRNDVKTLTTMGFLLNLLPLRFRAPEEKASFASVLASARDTARAALDNSRLPFDVLLNELDVQRSATYSPIFQVFLDYKQYSVKMPRILKAQAEGERFDGATGYDMVLDIKDIAGGDMIVTVRTQKALYPTHANLLLRSFIHMLENFSDDSSTRADIAALFSDEDAAQAVQLGRGPSLRSAWPETLSHRIDNMATQYPNDIALRDGLGNSLTYNGMQNKVEAISYSLLQANITPGKIIAVFQEPSAMWICSLLSIWRVGATYCPLDPKRGLASLYSIAASVKPDLILFSSTTARDVSAFAATGAATINIDSDVPNSVHSTTNRASASAPAVILFTSGSTGAPKGIELAHAGLVNLLEGYNDTFDLGRPVVLQHTTYSFDIALDQIITGLGLGGSVYVASAAQRQDSRLLAAVVADAGITYTKATPSEFVSWISHGFAELSKAQQWRWAVVGGERWNDTLRAAFHSLQLPKLELQNCYGPTEATIVCTKKKMPVDQQIQVFSAGRALPNTSLYISDDQGRAHPIGIVGEVVIGGAGAALGYLNNAELTNEKFIVNRYAPAEYLAAGWNKAFRTGDIGYLQEDGSLVCVGRIDGDTQVKLRGVRVQLDDIESTIVSASAGVFIRAVASVRGESPLAQVLVAFVEFAAHVQIEERAGFLTQFTARLALSLSQSMMPGLITELPGGIPLNHHNKIDRRAVHALPLGSTVSGVAGLADVKMTTTECSLREIWIGILPENIAKAVTIHPHTNFFHVGGNSLMVISLQKEIHTHLGALIPLAKLLEVSTLAGLAAIVDASLQTKPIDWDAETALDDDILAITPCPVTPVALAPKLRTVLLTGAAGFAGSHILEALLADASVSRVHAVAIRPLPSSDPKRARLHELAEKHSSRVILHAGNLTEPRLGMSEATFTDIASEVNVIIHSGGSRSFWDSYAALRSDNVVPTHELIHLAGQACMRRGAAVALHYISTGDAELVDGPGDGSAGYVATKWVSEHLLSSAASHLNLPLKIYRMIPTQECKSGGTEQEKEALFTELALLGKKIGAVPTQGTWAGRWDLMPVNKLASTVVEAVLDESAEAGVRFIPLRASVSMTMNEVSQRMSEVEPALIEGMNEIPGHVWFGQAKLAGLTYQVTSMGVSLQDANGEEIGRLHR
ncbi:hybrid NRPS/PKS enzyme [Penicillium sp. IBT 35674x]|nr:hybrid NRPS/PKS enzyme [Penicillium sp. IBT 35674x]